MWDWDFALQILPDLLRASLITMQATVLGMSLAVVLGLLWALLRRARRRLIAVTTAWSVEFIRSTPLLVQIYFLFFILPDFGIRLSPLTTGILALGLHYSAYTSEVYRAGIESVPNGQWEAALALNMSPTHMWLAVILPQAIPPVIPALGNYLVAMFKDTPMLAAITVLELLQTAKLIGAATFRYLEPLTLVGLLFLAISLLASRFIHKLEARFGSR
ncbi:MAG: ectoine/hydroxyectoine ABC transporter permease subunit EhuD [Gammaproteobacteria bacterium]|jgi:polar amino acid transport system permease protein